MASKRLAVLAGGKAVPIESDQEEIDFLSVRIGPSNLTLSELDAATLSTNGKKIRAADGTDVGDAATKGQVDSEASARTNADNDLQDQIDTQDGILDDHETRIDTAETDINDLQGDLASILANNPKQGRFVTVGTTTTFDLSTLAEPITVDADNTILDVEMWVNGARWVQCTVGNFSTGGFRKNSTSEIEVSASIPENAEVIFWKQGTSSAGGGGSDLAAITTDPRPDTAAGHWLGTLARPWAGLYVKDTVTAQVYLIQITNGAFEAVEVP